MQLDEAQARMPTAPQWLPVFSTAGVNDGAGPIHPDVVKTITHSGAIERAKEGHRWAGSRRVV